MNGTHQVLSYTDVNLISNNMGMIEMNPEMLPKACKLVSLAVIIGKN